MRNILIALTAFAVIALGAFVRYLVDGQLGQRIIATDGLCVDVLHLQTNLPLSQYGIVRQQNLLGITKDSLEYILVYPLPPGLQIPKEQPAARLLGTIANSNWQLYAIPRPGASVMYGVQSELPFLISSLTSDSQAAVDLETLVRGMRVVVQCPANNVRYVQPKNAVQVWIGTVGPSTRQTIEDGYVAFAANYKQPLSAKPLVRAVACSAYIVDHAAQQLSATDKTSFATAFNRVYNTANSPAELIKQPQPNGISMAVATIIREYFAPRLEQEFPSDVKEQVKNKILAATKGKVDVTTFSKKDCAGLGIPATIGNGL